MNPLKQLIEVGLLSPIDERLAESLARRAGEERSEVILAIALASRAVQAGHVCAELTRQADLLQAYPEATLELPPVDPWVKLLKASPLVSETADESNPTPLILDEAGRLYLYRYARYQARLAQAIEQRVNSFRSSSAKATDRNIVANILAQLFPEAVETPSTKPAIDRQRLAAIAATRSNFTLISGGPGTGKTYTVAKLLVLLFEQARQQSLPPPRIKLLAPTGKAAQRLGESIQKSLSALNCDEAIRTQVPKEAVTIHRALGFQPQTPTRFIYHASNPLPVDVVLVDEASMVDLALMSKLVDAVPLSARFILLGDKDQLASVEAGAILGDIYGTEDGYSTEFASAVNELTGESLETSPTAPPLRDCMVHLTHSRRYGERSGIGALARAINAGNVDAALDVFQSHEDVERLPLPSTQGAAITGLPERLEEKLEAAFFGLKDASPEQQLQQLSGFRVLCAHRRGALGVEALNSHIQRFLHLKGLIDARTEWYVGRPILITANDYQLGLYNGDVGVLNRNPKTGVVEAYFEGNETELRTCSAARLPAHETVFAMTVHKSQGSEFDEVALLLPEELSPVLTRELVYTGVTRAKRRVSVLTEEPVFAEAILRRIERASGLRQALWGAASD